MCSYHYDLTEGRDEVLATLLSSPTGKSNFQLMPLQAQNGPPPQTLHAGASFPGVAADAIAVHAPEQ